MGKGILVVEDNEYNLKLLRNLLQIGGYTVFEARTGEEGLEQVRERLPDLILMDIQLPGLDGLSAATQIKNDPELKDIPVIALTAYAMEGDRQRALAAGCNGYISKPIDTRTFLDELETYLHPSQGK